MTPAETLLHALVDDAGLFPPTALPMPDAVRRHRADRAGGEAVLTHRFLCPASRVEELRRELVESDRFAVGLIADHGPDGLGETCASIAGDPRLSLDLLEIPLAAFTDRDGDESGALHHALEAVASVPTTVPAYLEPSAPSRVEPLLAAIAAAPGRGFDGGRRSLGAKLRCGGVRAELFPSPAVAAHFVTACAAAGVPFKATAGLHHAVRHTAPDTGFVHHGYLNLLLATAAAVSGGTEADVRGVLETEDPVLLTAAVAAMSGTEAANTRRTLVGYGSCSTQTPVHDAAAMLGPNREGDHIT